jgi:Do/DeqQ family serine protease
MTKMTFRKRLLAVCAALALIVPALVYSGGKTERAPGQGAASTAPAPSAETSSQALEEATKNLATIQYSFREVARKVLPTVVEVDVTEQMRQSSQAQSPFDWFFNQPGNNKGGQAPTRQGLGSGIVVQRAGSLYYVLTNNHVVDQATDISVKLADQQVFDAKVVGTDPRRDLALVSFSSRAEIPVAELGNSGELQVGDLVLAVGNPFGFENTVTMGIVSAVGRSSPSSSGVASNTDYIQTDAAINQGNSGGALVNIKGEVVGINTWIAAPNGGSIGLGFAIPINNAKKAVTDFVAKGRVEYGFLGVQPIDPSADPYAGVASDLKVDNVKGALIVNVYKDSPADKAGILPGDFITRVNDRDVQDTNKLIQAVGDLLAGTTYDFELIRYGEKQKLSATLTVRPPDGSDATAYNNLWAGIVAVRINDQVRKQLNVPKDLNGIAVGAIYADTPDNQTAASLAGFRPGDVIEQMNGKDVRTVMDFYRDLNDKSNKEVQFKINRNGTELTIGLPR